VSIIMLNVTMLSIVKLNAIVPLIPSLARK
jgi:hypothetical protein